MTATVTRRSYRLGRLRVSGGDRVRFLQGLTTVNVEQLADGGTLGAIPEPEGPGTRGDRRRPDRRGLRDRVRARDHGKDAHPARALRGDGRRHVRADHRPRAPDLGRPDRGLARADHRGRNDHSRDDSRAAIEHMRIRAGFLRYGVDVGEDNFPFETPLTQFLDYAKGCYVARSRCSASTRRQLRQDAAWARRRRPGAARARRRDQPPAKENAGIVTSSVIDGDTTLAMGYLHRTCWTPGENVSIEGRRAVVHELRGEVRCCGGALGLAAAASSPTASSPTSSPAIRSDPADLSSGAIILGLRQAGVPDRTRSSISCRHSRSSIRGPASPLGGERGSLLLGQDGPGGRSICARSLTDAQMLALHPCTGEPCTSGRSAPRDRTRRSSARTRSPRRRRLRSATSRCSCSRTSVATRPAARGPVMACSRRRTAVVGRC